jgi:hypothetical protein
MQTIEQQVAQQIVHQERTQAILARTGGEIMHPDHYDMREAFRLGILEAIDAISEENGYPRMSDAELPTLFKALDGISERLFLKSVGL